MYTISYMVSCVVVILVACPITLEL
jgi:hypothetical protein